MARTTKKDVNTKETTGENFDSLVEVNEIGNETEKGGNSGADSGSGLAATEAGNPDETPKKSVSTTGTKLVENKENISNATAQLILQKLEEAS